MRERSLDPAELRRRLGALMVDRVRALELVRAPVDVAVVVGELNDLARYWLEIRELVEVDGQTTRRLEGVCDALDFLERVIGGRVELAEMTEAERVELQRAPVAVEGADVSPPWQGSDAERLELERRECPGFWEPLPGGDTEVRRDSEGRIVESRPTGIGIDLEDIPF
jgi:hypothetical protein